MEEADERHARTALLLASLGRVGPAEATRLLDALRFGISATREYAETTAGQAAVLTAVNILARTGGGIHLELPPAPLLLEGLPWRGSLSEVAKEMITWAGGRRASAAETIITIGGTPDDQRISIGGTDWLAVVDETTTPAASTHPLGAVAAACFGAARAFHLALGKELRLPGVDRSPLRFSLLDYGSADKPNLNQVRLREFTLVGAGAVGQAVLWSLLAGQVDLPVGPDIVDPQTLDASNLNRHLLAGIGDRDQAKANIASRFVAARASASRPHVQIFADFTKGRAPADLIVSTVDNDQARYEIQGALPRLVLHGATSNELVGAGLLDIADGACLACLFLRKGTSVAEEIVRETGIGLDDVSAALQAGGRLTERMLPPLAERLGTSIESLGALVGRDFREAYATEICGRLRVPLRPDLPAPAIGYVSTLAGVILAAELVKLSTPGFEERRLRNYLQLGVLSPTAAWIAERPKDPDCPLFCGSPALQRVIADRRKRASRDR